MQILIKISKFFRAAEGPEIYIFIVSECTIYCFARALELMSLSGTLALGEARGRRRKIKAESRWLVCVLMSTILIH